MPLSPFAARFAALASGKDPGFVSTIDPSDEMYTYGLHSLRGSHDAAAVLYFSTGRLIADSISEALGWRFHDAQDDAGAGAGPRSILDFASGYGRVTRFLARRFPPAAITVAEVDEASVRFQERAFGVRGTTSPPDPESFTPGVFDAVVAVSFFSHVPEARFTGWLGRLWSCVAPGGILLFSTHGPTLLGDSADWSRGIVFRPSSETDRLDPDVYGTSWVTSDFVAAAAGSAALDGVLHGIPFGLDGRQDLFALVRPPRVPAGSPPLGAVPRGDLDALAVSSARLSCEGALDSPEEARVGFWVRGEERAWMLLPAGGESRRWKFDIALDDVALDDVLRVEALSPAGRARVLAMGTLRPLL